VAVFLVLLAVCVTCLSNLFINKWKRFCYESVTPKQFYELDQDSVEVLFLGSSQATLGISGMKMYEDYGISTYTLGSPRQPMLGSYGWLVESTKTQNIRTAVVDVAALYYGTLSESRYRQSLDNMKLSLNKLQLIYEHCKLNGNTNADPFFSYIFRISKYHSRWKELTEEDYTNDSVYQPVFRGNVLYSDSVTIDLAKLAYDNDEPEEGVTMNSESVQYLERMAQFCEENGIELLLIKVPRYDWSITQHEQVEAFAEEHDLTFLDLSSSDTIAKIGLDENDYMDKKHPNISGATKISAYLGAYLKENYDLTDFREVEGYDELNYQEYCDRVEDSYLQRATDVVEYLQYLKNDRYDILIQTTADITGYCTQELLDTFEALNLKANIQELNGQTYVAQVNRGLCVYEAVSAGRQVYGNYLSDGVKYTLCSTYAAASTPAITVDFESISFANKGINILVYDSDTNRIVDKSTLVCDETSGGLVLQKENEKNAM
jgi:hypothetical protein